MKTKIFLSFLILFLFFSCSSDENTEPIKKQEPIVLVAEKTILNESYGTNSKQVFDLYLPKNRTENATKTLILVHGGGWTEGDKADMDYLISFIKQNLPGYAIANMNYRLSTPGNPALPMQTDDLNSLFNKLKNENYGISDNFGFIGVSAGAHLSLLYSYTNNPNNNIKMVASIVGPTNFTDPQYVNNSEWISRYLLITGLEYSSNITYFQNASPLFKATTNSPPTIMLYGDNDDLVPISQGRDLHNKLDQLGVYNEFNLYAGGHGNWAPLDILRAYTSMVNFIKLKF
jgi:acetyl esterase/lipase